MHTICCTAEGTSFSAQWRSFKLESRRKVAPEAFAALCDRYGFEVRMDSIPGLVERFGVRFPGDPAF